MCGVSGKLRQPPWRGNRVRHQEEGAGGYQGWRGHSGKSRAPESSMARLLPAGKRGLKPSYLFSKASSCFLAYQEGPHKVWWS